MSELLKVCGLWKGEDKNGKTMLSGSMGGVRVLVLLNKFKEKDNHPDYQLFFAKKERKEDGPERPDFLKEDADEKDSPF